MAILSEDKLKANSLLEIAGLMLIAARTAPKGRGRDNIYGLVITGEDIQKLADKMTEIGNSTAQSFFLRDAGNLAHASAVVLLGARVSPANLTNCGYCGHETCSNKEKFPDAPCAFNSLDLGIAIGSAVSVAANHHADNRVMFSAGKAALALGFFPADTRIALAIPLAAMAKNPFFDRG
jgi:uncharacterized ferredoxin-like protein